MNPKAFPKRLDSKTSCLRITVPENLDLALEGLIRKVLKEQPKTDDIYSFAANYFETLLNIRDKAGAKFTAAQLCPFHEDEEAHEMIILADTFSKRVPEKLRRKQGGSVNLKTQSLGNKKGAEETLLHSLVPRTKETLNDAKSEGEKKQTMPDLIKKLPLSAPKRAEAADGDPKGENSDSGKGIDEEGFLTSDPIKELVEKELLIQASEKEGSGKRRQLSEGKPTAGGDDAGTRPEADEAIGTEGNESGRNEADGKNPREERLGEATSGVTVANEGGRKQDFGKGISEDEEKGGEVVELEKGKPENQSRLQPNGCLLLEEKTENVEETVEPRKDERLESEIETGLEDIDATQLDETSDATKENSKEFTREMFDSHDTASQIVAGLEDRGVTQILTEETFSPEKELASDDSGENNDQPNAESSIKPRKNSEKSELPAGNELAEALLLPIKPDEVDLVVKYDDLTKDTDKSQDQKTGEETDQATDSPVQGEEKTKENLAKENASGGTEGHKINPDFASLTEERAKLVQELKEALHQRKEGVLSKEGEGSAANMDDPGDLNHQPTEKETETEENVTKVLTKPENTALPTNSGDEPRETKAIEQSEKLDPIEEGRGAEDLTKLDNSLETNRPERQDEEKKVEAEELKAKDGILTESSGEQTILAENSQADDVAKAPEGLIESQTNARGDRRISDPDIQLANEESKGKTQENVNQEVPGGVSIPTVNTDRLPRDTTDEEASEVATSETESVQPAEFEHEAPPEAENAPLPAEELCSVVDILHIPKEGPQGLGSPEEHLGRPHSKGIAEGKSVTESGDSRSSSHTQSAPVEEKAQRENSEDSEGKDPEKTPSKTESEEPPIAATTHQETVKPESDKKEVDSEEEPTPDKRDLQSQSSSAAREIQSEVKEVDPSADGKHIVIIDEPDRREESPEMPHAEEPTGEIQIKTIQTHYYDALRVPEVVTKEYRVHGVAGPGITDVVGAAAQWDEVGPPPEVEKGPKQPSAEDNAASPPTNSPAEAAEARRPEDPGERGSLEPAEYSRGVKADASPLLDAFGPDVQMGDRDVTSEINLRTANEMFLNSERCFSSLDKEEIRYVAPRADGAADSETSKGRPEVDEIFQKTVVPPSEETSRAPPSGTDEAERPSAEGTKEDAKGEGPPAHPNLTREGVTPDGRRRRNSPIDPATTKTVSEARDEEATRGAAKVEPETTTDAQDEMEPSDAGSEGRPSDGVSGCPRTPPAAEDRRSISTEAQEKNEPEPDAEEPRADERTAVGEGSSVESDSTAASAATEIKRADSARRSFASAPTLPSGRSLDLGKRNPLVRTRSLSTHRHGVADFEVWSTIEKELEEAATKIQSKYRGYKTRKKLRRENAVQITTEESSTRTTPVEAEDGDEHRRATGEFHDCIVLSDHPR